MPSAPSAPGSATVVGLSYRDQLYWLRYQDFFPGALRLTVENAPAEQWWSWRGMKVHVDRVARPSARTKLIALHGVGTYGRMLGPYGRLPSLVDLEFLAPDLPGFGLTNTGRRTIAYQDWLACVLDLIELERSRDERPIVLLGISTGGRLAYDVAALAGGAVAGVITTCLADPQRDEVRRRLAARPEMAQWSGLLTLIPKPLTATRVPVHWMANIAAVSNHAQFANLVWADSLGGGSWLTLGFVRSCLAAAPAAAPEDYAGPPVLLAHPDEDRWTPPLLSKRFFDRIAGPTRSALLGGTGHLPVEESGLADLDRAIRDFLDELGLE
ncbi:alpha/beta hydrolase [Saccharopolyspora phatthalungensis]|uniref:Alpha-beta hydrolase superfamily lysophospholipase n=1 Tax=Saccharopolyspora phatthalungensis TaxID=664693 RepID=A0A840Q2L6_9PSEU|nr:alpha/beta fold hydrolase [Saccharopolyspora phatthalungensis]MBB5154704.1 alpha-beta hydrolase superfamily lysophospholipase [Saccharopolyspora phatthalungensis]